MKTWIKALAVGLCGCVILSFCGFAADCEEISNRVLRLHVLAASDSAEDQAIKLKVRDAILEETGGLLDGVYSTDEARDVLSSMLPAIQAVAQTCLRENGSSHTVTVELCETYFTTRQYASVTLPAGYYEALRVVIGEGKGKNWWCVVFPPMCLSGAKEMPVSDVLTPTQTSVVTQPAKYQVRFKVVEWWQELCGYFR